MKNLIVVISPTGEVQVATEGIKGKSCQAIVENFSALFGDEKSATHTPEYFEKVEASQELITHDNLITS